MAARADQLRRARERADARRGAYRRAGVWSADPLDVVCIGAERYPLRQAVIDRAGSLTYAELDQRVDRACRLLTAAGLQAPEPVVLVVGNDIDSLVAVHAANRIDAVVLLVPRSSGPAQISDIIRRTGASYGVAPNWADTRLVCGPEGFEWIDLAAGARSNAKPPAAQRPRQPADEPSFVLFTSGTTAKPKGVIHSLSTLAKASSNYIAAAGLGPAERLFLISPLASVTGVVQALFIAPMLGAPVILEDRWDPVATSEFLVSSESTWYGGPDRLLDRVLDHAVALDHPVPLRAVYLGGTSLDRRIVERIEDDFGIIVMRAYGSSEVPVSASGRRSEPRDIRHADDGLPLDGVEVRVGSVGDPTECCIRGPHAFLGYTDAADDEAVFDGDWVRTGDVADVIQGRIRIVGRLRDLVIRNGLKIAVTEVEEAVARIAGVRECAAYSVADTITGERLAVAIVVDPGMELTLGEVADALMSAGLPKYKLPEELVFWDEPLPVNANGKVERNTLDKHSAGRPRKLAARLAGG